eukprot:2613218-Prymnesium_polylepis.2
MARIPHSPTGAVLSRIPATTKHARMIVSAWATMKFSRRSTIPTCPAKAVSSNRTIRTALTGAFARRAGIPCATGMMCSAKSTVSGKKAIAHLFGFTQPTRTTTSSSSSSAPSATCGATKFEASAINLYDRNRNGRQAAILGFVSGPKQ